MVLEISLYFAQFPCEFPEHFPIRPNEIAGRFQEKFSRQSHESHVNLEMPAILHKTIFLQPDGITNRNRLFVPKELGF